MNAREAEALFARSGAMQRGHFLLSSGRHSDRYFQKASVLEDPVATMALAREIASWYPKVEVVLAPALGAIPLGFAVALAAGARSLFAEREGGSMRLRRGFVLSPGERTLIAEDVVTTGGSALELWELAGAAGAERLGVAALIDRSAGAPLGFPLRAVLTLRADSWAAEACPLCRDGVSPDSPGSHHLTVT